MQNIIDRNYLGAHELLSKKFTSMLKKEITKYLIVGYGYDYYKKVYAQIADLDYAEYCYKVNLNRFEQLFAKFCLSHKTRNFIPSIIKKKLSNLYISKLKIYIEKLNITQSDTLCFIMLSGGLNNDLLQFGLTEEIRKKYPFSKIVYFCSDLIETTHKPIELIKQKSDLVISFDPVDAEKYGIYYHQIPYSDIRPDIQGKDKKFKSDICFVGAAKNRLEEIYQVFDYLSNNGCICDFHLIGVPEDKRIAKKGLSYEDYISYDQNLQIILSSNCLLEIIQHNSSGNTLRTNEAVIFNKKLLSNNAYLRDSSVWTPQNMRIFSNSCEIDIDFIKNKSNVHYSNKELLYPQKFLNQVTRWLK